MRGDVRRLQARHCLVLVVQGLEFEAAIEDPAFLPAHISFVGTLSDLGDDVLY